MRSRRQARLGRRPGGRTASRRRGDAPGKRADDSDARHIGKLYQQIYRVVRKIPRGTVATYGQVAELAGMPGAARVVGAAMRASVPELGLPWHRVVGKRSPGTAGVSILDPVGAAVQQALLEGEGVALTPSGGISLREHGWLPVASKKKKAGQNKASRSRPGAGSRRGRQAGPGRARAGRKP